MKRDNVGSRARKTLCLAVGSVVVLAGANMAWSRPATSLESSYGNVPLNFEFNSGQTDGRVKFLARGNGYALFLTETQAVFKLQKARVPASRQTRKNEPCETTVIRTDLLGANVHPVVTGEDPLPGRVNYLLGRDSTQWRSGIIGFRKIKSAGVYPGIDLIYYGNQRQLEYDFVVAPNADPNAIRFSLSGSDKLSIDSSGNLVIQAGGTILVQHAPIVYQMVDGARRPIVAGFRLQGNEVAFQLGKYDPKRTLIIDPILSYSTYLGGTGDDIALWSDLDSNNNLYMAGFTTSLDFPTTPGVFQNHHASGNWDVFVTKLNASGSALVYSTYIGGSGDDFAFGISVHNGRAYVVGTTGSTDYPLKNAIQPSFGGGPEDSFVTVLDPSGASLVYSTYLGGNGDDQAYIGPTLSDGTIYVVGFTASANFPVTRGAFQTRYQGGAYDAFVTKLDPTGRHMQFSTFVGGSGEEHALDGTLDSLGNVVFTGWTNSTNFPTSPGAFQTSYGGGDADTFIVKLNSNGSSIAFGTYVGGRNHDEPRDCRLDAEGNAYVPGFTSSLDFPTTHDAFQARYGGGANDGFLAVVNPHGHGVYSTFFGGSGDDLTGGVSVPGVGRPYIVGRTGSTDLPITRNALQRNFGGGNYDVFVAQLGFADPQAPAGSSPQPSGLFYCSFFGGNGDEEANGQGVNRDSSGSIYVVGDTTSTNLATTPGAFESTLAGGVDTFAAKFSFSQPGTEDNTMLPPLPMTPAATRPAGQAPPGRR